MCFNHDNNEMKFCQIKLLYTCKTTYCWHFTTKIQIQMQFLVSNCRMLLNFIVIKDPVTFIADNYSKACSVLCQLKCCRAYISSWKRYRLGVPFMRHDLFSKQLQKKERALTLAMFCCFFFQTSQLIKEQLVARGFCRHAAALSFELPPSQWWSRDLPRGSNVAFSLTHGPTTRQRRNLSGHTVAV